MSLNKDTDSILQQYRQIISSKLNSNSLDRRFHYDWTQAQLTLLNDIPDNQSIQINLIQLQKKAIKSKIPQFYLYFTIKSYMQHYQAQQLLAMLTSLLELIKNNSSIYHQIQRQISQRQKLLAQLQSIQNDNEQLINEYRQLTLEIIQLIRQWIDNIDLREHVIYVWNGKNYLYKILYDNESIIRNHFSQEYQQLPNPFFLPSNSPQTQNYYQALQFLAFEKGYELRDLIQVPSFVAKITYPELDQIKKDQNKKSKKKIKNQSETQSRPSFQNLIEQNKILFFRSILQDSEKQKKIKNQKNLNKNEKNLQKEQPKYLQKINNLKQLLTNKQSQTDKIERKNEGKIILNKSERKNSAPRIKIVLEKERSLQALIMNEKDQKQLIYKMIKNPQFTNLPKIQDRGIKSQKLRGKSVMNLYRKPKELIQTKRQNQIIKKINEIKKDNSYKTFKSERQDNQKIEKTYSFHKVKNFKKIQQLASTKVIEKDNNEINPSNELILGEQAKIKLLQDSKEKRIYDSLTQQFTKKNQRIQKLAKQIQTIKQVDYDKDSEQQEIKKIIVNRTQQYKQEQQKIVQQMKQIQQKIKIQEQTYLKRRQQRLNKLQLQKNQQIKKQIQQLNQKNKKLQILLESKTKIQENSLKAENEFRKKRQNLMIKVEELSRTEQILQTILKEKQGKNRENELFKKKMKEKRLQQLKAEEEKQLQLIREYQNKNQSLYTLFDQIKQKNQKLLMTMETRKLNNLKDQNKKQYQLKISDNQQEKAQKLQRLQRIEKQVSKFIQQKEKSIKLQEQSIQLKEQS